MGYTKVLYFLVLCVIILTVMVLYLFFPLLGMSAPTTETRPPPSITVIDHSGEVNKSSGTYIVTGTAQNTGKTPVVKVYLVVTTYDANGSVIGDTYGALMNMNPGDKKTFRIEAWPFYNGIIVARHSIVPDYGLVPSLRQ
jgi:hypothetical protein